jgi:hypothetical protein
MVVYVTRYAIAGISIGDASHGFRYIVDHMTATTGTVHMLIGDASHGFEVVACEAKKNGTVL